MGAFYCFCIENLMPLTAVENEKSKNSESFK